MPDESKDCPDASALASFHAGELDAQAAGVVSEHSLVCSTCRAELAELALDLAFRDELRALVACGSIEPGAPARGDGTHEPAYHALVALLKESAAGGRYEILGELGRGGMGVVYEVHDRVLHRDLAMKIARSDGWSATGVAPLTGRRLARFLEEVRITGRLEHPAIISVHELGLDANGHPYFTMNRVRGQDLHEVFLEFERGSRKWTLQQLIAIVLRACEALAYAHSKGVVHRDLKPANIMVGAFDAVYVMDWGIAKVLPNEANTKGEPGRSRSHEAFDPGAMRARDWQDHTPDSPPNTLDGEVLGTPSYMAPEQARGRTNRVDRSADVYSMGAILYRLLSRQRPFEARGQSSTPHTEWRRLLDGPPRPLAEVVPKAPPELVAICERAMARDPGARYSDMVELTADLRAWLEGRVVRAHRTGVVIEARKWFRRNRALSSAASVTLIVLLGMLLWHRRAEALSQAEVTHWLTALTAQRLLEDEPEEALHLALKVASAEETYLSRTTLLSALVPVALDASLRHPARSMATDWSLESASRAWSPTGDRFAVIAPMVKDGPAKLRVWNVGHRAYEAATFDAPGMEIINFHPDGHRLASGGANGHLTIHDLVTGRTFRLQDESGRGHSSFVARLAFDPSGTLLASASWDGSIRLWSTGTLELQRTLEGHTGNVTAIEFDSTGTRLLSASGPSVSGFESDWTARIWDVASGTCQLVFAGHHAPVSSARFGPTGALVLSTSYASSGGSENTAQLWNASTGELETSMQLPGVGWDCAFAPDGETVAVAFDAGFLVRDVARDSGHEERFGRYEAHNGRAVVDVEFAPDGHRLLTTGLDGVGRVWRLETARRPRLEHQLRSSAVRTMGSWSPDGAAIVTSSVAATRLWLADGNPAARGSTPTGSAATHALFHAAGDRVLLTCEGSPALEFTFTPEAGIQMPPTALGVGHANDVTTTSDGQWTLVAEASGCIRCWRRSPDGSSREECSIELGAHSLVASSTNTQVGAILTDGGAAIIDCVGVPVVTARLADGELVRMLRFSDDGRRVALGTSGGRLLCFDLSGGVMSLVDARLQRHSPSQTSVFDVAFYDAGRGLIAAGAEPGVSLLDVERGRLSDQRVDFYGGMGTVGGLLVLGDGRQLLRDQWRLRVHLVDRVNRTATRLQHESEGGAHRNLITSWSLSGTERQLLTTSLDHTATIWDLERAEPWVTFTAHDAPILAGDLSRDGSWALTADSSGCVYVWRTDPLARMDELGPIEVDFDGR
jgi:WD40 repeat protein/serine/threonine protein kinase